MGGGVTISASPATASVPTGEHRIATKLVSDDQFTVPNGITVVMVLANVKRYIGVTPGKTYKLTVTNKPQYEPPDPGIALKRLAHDNTVWNYITADAANFVIYWSPEINKQTPTITDY